MLSFARLLAFTGLFAFASELTALAQHPHVSRSLDIRALQKLNARGVQAAKAGIAQAQEIYRRVKQHGGISGTERALSSRKCL